MTGAYFHGRLQIVAADPTDREAVARDARARSAARTISVGEVSGDPASASTFPTDRDWSWRDDAVCAGLDPDLFFPERGASSGEAKAVCRGCPVRSECLEHAMSVPEKFGIWGGLSEKERRRLRRSKAIAAREIRGVA